MCSKARTRRSAAGRCAAVASEQEGALSALANVKDGDLLLAQTENGPMWLEVQQTPGKDGQFCATTTGYEVLVVPNLKKGTCQVELLGPVELPAEMFTTIKKHMGEEALDAAKEILKLPPVSKGTNIQLKDVSIETSYSSLVDRVTKNAAAWVDGANGKGQFSDPTLDNSALAAAISQAGEVFSLIEGKRGVVLLQLWTSKDNGAGGAVHNPLAVRALRQALSDKHIDAKLSLALTPQGEPLGLSLVLHANKCPFSNWATHLAELGVQSALVADTPFYKVMIGKILGYEEAKIVEHVESKGQECDAALLKEVDKELRLMSDCTPAMPWRDASSERADPVKGAVSSVKVNTGFGGNKADASKPKPKKKGSKKK